MILSGCGANYTKKGVNYTKKGVNYTKKGVNYTFFKIGIFILTLNLIPCICLSRINGG